MKPSQLFLLFTIIVMLNSCALYTPSAVNTPLFTEKGQLSANFSVATGENYQTAYALTDNFAIIANRFEYNIDDKDLFWDPETSPARLKNDLNLRGVATMNEIGYGYYQSYNKIGNNPHYKGVFELFGGYGKGVSSFLPNYFFKNSLGLNENVFFKHSYSTHKIFIQPTFGLKHNIIELAFTPRFTNVFYGKPKSDLPDSLWAVNGLNDIHKKSYTYFEPTGTFRIGYKGIKLQAQLSRSFIIGNKNFDDFNTGASFNVGMIFGVGLKKKKLLK
jgi:hypothetical protein